MLFARFCKQEGFEPTQRNIYEKLKAVLNAYNLPFDVKKRPNSANILISYVINVILSVSRNAWKEVQMCSPNRHVKTA